MVVVLKAAPGELGVPLPDGRECTKHFYRVDRAHRHTHFVENGSTHEHFDFEGISA